ncbi:pyruvate kinase PykF [Oceanivirga salmonicida]|uniref:pyruvate kinase PykF n=1 Tax=Oceanivirga salmonicida TaxID=1769291 RepID=UPI0009E92488|nr:pyruvate kinase PykF [Oceanivirga salmonicida]
MKKIKMTKIVCTIGPKSEKPEVLKELVLNGMNVMRLNFSHGDFEEHGGRIKTIRKISEETGKFVAILLDTKGPEIRTGSFAEGDIKYELKQDDKITLTSDYEFKGNKDKISISYPNMTKDLKPGNTILLDDGLIGLEVLEIKGEEIFCRVKNSGMLGQKKGVNLPGVSVSLPALAEKDIEDLKFGCKVGVDYVAASFIRKVSDVATVRKVLDENGGENIKIISKIENQEGIDNFDEILELSDGIMVARGDLGVEVPTERVPFYQKMMIKKCNKAGKPVITATQMLDSMQKNPRPTRAEAGDVANAILDGTDAVMLSGETANGKYPVEAVRTMANISAETDKFGVKKKISSTEVAVASITEAISKSAVYSGESLDAKLIICWTKTGRAAKMLRKYNPKMPIIALTDNEQTGRQLALIRGVRSVLAKNLDNTDDFFKKAIEVASGHIVTTNDEDYTGIKKGDLIVLVTGISETGTTNTLKITRIGE